MAVRRVARSCGVGLLMLPLVAAVGCSRGGSARTDYFAARSVSRSASPGDGSTIAFGPGASGASWSAELSFAPVAGDGDLAAGPGPEPLIARRP